MSRITARPSVVQFTNPLLNETFTWGTQTTTELEPAHHACYRCKQETPGTMRQESFLRADSLSTACWSSIILVRHRDMLTKTPRALEGFTGS
ncbi:hypothetical protein CEXT_419321 [Caerostris extrusa]|uniref:Uncharacterized protein n=1 Tax=Caerostris extrusa TaxID=172846 RepID=A0AAV4NL91_CAEEX|nr:hypothetical protein CEXT_419321 [Caerostris extrusa]